MEKKNSELFQILIFLVIFLGNLFLATRYYSREDILGTALFIIVVIASCIAALGHFIEWRKVR